MGRHENPEGVRVCPWRPSVYCSASLPRRQPGQHLNRVEVVASASWFGIQWPSEDPDRVTEVRQGEPGNRLADGLVTSQLLRRVLAGLRRLPDLDNTHNPKEFP